MAWQDRKDPEHDRVVVQVLSPQVTVPTNVVKLEPVTFNSILSALLLTPLPAIELSQLNGVGTIEKKLSFKKSERKICS